MYPYYWYGYPTPLSYPSPAPDASRQQQGMLPMEQSYIENILRLNLGKRVHVYMTFENNPEWPSQIFTGILDEAGRDHIVLRDEQEGRWYLLLMVYLDFVVFDEQMEYDYPDIPSSNNFLSEYPPR